ncbi:MAG: endo-1,4-beta-xylanase [Lachnospiraceae bacterium]|nr:endo-1,4-beta-xylanase [Lachnospiraceae bacterium]
MLRNKDKRIMALILSGVLLAGSLNPITSNAAEISAQTEIAEEGRTDDAGEKAEEGSEPETDTDRNSAEQSTVEESTAGEGTMEESSTDGDTTDERPVEDDTVEERTDEETTTEESSVSEETTEDDVTETSTEEDTQEECIALESDRQISANILKDYNPSFENGTDKALDWWNDLSWGQTYIAREHYEESGNPTPECGDYYLEVIPDADKKSGAQICHEDIAKIIKPEVTYEFTYFAKLSDGMDSGEVQFQVTSASKDWESKTAEVNLDSEVELESGQWKQVSGTFQIPAYDKNEQVKIEFLGSEDLSFCIDDLRVAAIDKGDIEYGDNLVKNPYFAESDLSVWEASKGDADITAATADEAIFDDINTYGVIGNRTSSYDCFAQDMTAVIQSGNSYEYSFYVMLDADDYKDAPPEQREVSFAPYVTVEGESTYWGSHNSGILDSGCIKKIPAGEWVKFEGSFNPKFEGEAEKLIIRILEQGTNYGNGDCVKGRYYVTGVTIHEVKKPVKEIEWDIPNLKDTVSGKDGIGSDAYTGALLTVSDLSDKPLMDLVQKHFNAVTFENELKMDALFGYHDNNNSAPGFDTITWTRADGTEMKDYKVPQLDYSRAEKILDALKVWNKDHPDSVIKVRGHVLVWHSQAPEWFFREDWDINKPDVSPAVMDARQEWYIKTVLEHFTGDSSPYKGMFYGWDVVNEAVSDSTGTYRHEDEKSSWWRVYKSEDFIVNAFRYANYYAPSELELYYNDYNECVGSKVPGIEKLLKEVKSHEADDKLPTRISAMGMQSHHTVSSPTVNQIRDAAVRYGKIVGKVQLTELDLKASDDFDGTDATLQNEYTKQAYRYKEIYDVMREVDAMDDIDVNGITIWGVIDGNSWLQEGSDVGGGADGSKRQVPLLFDDDYKAKPSFYAFVNADKLEPYIRSVTVMQAAEEDPYANGKTYGIQGIDAAFIPVWTDTELKVQVTVFDTTVSEDDAVRLYIDWNKSASESTAVTPITKNRSESQAQEGGYVAEFVVSRDLMPSVGFRMDVVVSDNGQNYAFNDMTMNQDTGSKYYASAITKPYMTIAGVGSDIIKVDGEKEAVWDQAKEIDFQIRTGSAKASASARLLWDKQYLYVLADVTDPVLDKTSTAEHEQDSLEVFIDENNHKSDSYEEDDKQYRVNYANEQSFNGQKCNADNILSKAVETDKGYRIEAAYKWTDITPALGNKIGIDLQINDAEGGTRIGTVSWYDESGQGWTSTGVFGTATLGDLIKTPDLDIREELNSLISDCENFLKDAKEEDYTPETWTAFIEALEAAKTVWGNEEAAPETVEAAYDALAEARIALKPSTKTETPAEKELRNLIAECEMLKKEEYTDESWVPFATAMEEAKAVLANPDAPQEEVQKALDALKDAKAKLQKTDESEPISKDQLKELIEKCEERNPNDYTKESWAFYEKALADAKAVLENAAATQEDVQTAAARLSEALSQLKEREGLWAFDISDITYTGKALKPAVTVYDGRTLLALGKDYTVTYKNNTKPTERAEAVIKGKGNYAGSITKTFKIVPKDLTDEDITVPDLYVKAPKPGRNVTVAPTVTRNGKKLAKKEFTVDSIKDKTGSNVERVTEPGTYTVAVKGVDANGYTGSKEIQLVVLNNEQVLMSAVKVTGIQNKVYTGDKIVPEFTVKYGNHTLVPNQDYQVTCDSTEIGTATAVIKGIGETYVGEKTVTFKITGIALKAKDVTLENAVNLSYTGNEIKPAVKIAGAEQGRDFTVAYDKNVKAGTASVTIKGIGKYTGTVKKTFKIAPFDIQKNPEGKLGYNTADIIVPYMKGGSKLNETDLKAVFNGQNLIEGVDYTMVYSGNKKLDTATVKIKGKGNFKGTTEPISFTIVPQDIANLTNIILSDVTKKNARKYSNVNLTIKDFDGKPLKKGTDYKVTYTKQDGTTPIEGTPNVGDVIRATVEGINCYRGTTYMEFRIIEDSVDISKAKVKVEPQSYTGKEITLSEMDPATGKQQIFVTMKIGGEDKLLREGEDYEIVKNGYSKNIYKGTGKMTIRGINGYGGIKTVSFKIKAQNLDRVVWYENLYKWSMSWYRENFSR